MGIGNIATTGMQAAMTNMEVISNNISNANTPAFKSSYTNFADLYPSGNASSVQAGLGVSVTGIQQSFTPGGPTPTNLQSDLAITNNGFFIMRDVTSGQTSYSRYGRFNFSNDGYLMIGNERLQGFPATNGVIPPGSTPADLLINTAAIPAKATSTVTQQQLNLNASDSSPANPIFNPTDNTSYNFTSTAAVYDSLGNNNTLNLYYIKTSANNWTVNAYVNGSPVGVGSLTFNGSGQLISTTGLSSLTFSPTSGATSPQTFAVDMSGTTQFAKAYNASAFTSDGYQAGKYASYNIDNNGIVTVKYDNNQTVTAGQVALAIFQSPNGLQNIGNMSWISTAASGNPLINQSNSQNALQQAAIEMSNVDLASEMVNLVSAQNIFQANAQVEQTYNQVMQTVTKLG